MKARSVLVCGAVVAVAVVSPALPASASSAGANVRVTVDVGSAYVSADKLAGGSYTDGVLARCGVDRRMQNEPTLAVDPRDPRTLYMGSELGLFRSTDGADRWERVESPVNGRQIWSILVSPHDPDVIVDN